MIEVRVKPGSKKAPQIKLEPSGVLTVYVHEQAQDGEANQAVASLLADYYKISKSSIELVGGQKSKRKFFRINSLK